MTQPTDPTSIMPQDEPSVAFVELVVRHQHDLSRFLRALGVRGNDLEELSQQTMIKVWEKWSEFDPTREFLPWALKFAHLEVLKFRQRRRSERLIFSDDVLQAITTQALEHPQLYEMRLSTLRQCLRRLRPRDYDLLLSKYGTGMAATELAAKYASTTKAIYRRLDRVRAVLADCVRLGMIHVGN